MRKIRNHALDTAPTAAKRHSMSRAPRRRGEEHLAQGRDDTSTKVDLTQFKQPP
jgi:hypothetical protein